MRRNDRKRVILDFLAVGTRPATVQEIAWGIRLPYPARGLYSLLARYAHFGLVLRHRGPGDRFKYRIGEKGRARLAWLKRHK